MDSKVAFGVGILSLFIARDIVQPNQVEAADQSKMPGIRLSTDSEWGVSFDGRVNAYATWINGDANPTTVDADGVVFSGDALEEDLEAFRLRTGFNPSALGLNVRAPQSGRYKMGARIGLYPSIQNDRLKNGNTNLDVREVFFTVEAAGMGQFQVGRSLSLYQREHVVLDVSGSGIGAAGTGGNGTTAGRVGFGYLYDNFAPAVIYRTPSSKSFNWAVGLYDPSIINGAEDVSASITKTPRLETEATMDFDLGGSNLRVFASGLWQEATFNADVAGVTANRALEGDDVTATGLGYGVSWKNNAIQVDLAGYDGEALGTVVMLDGNALDLDGTERDHSGWMTQLHVFLGDRTTLTFSAGASEADETRADALSGNSYIEEQSSASVIGVYKFNDWLKLTAEMTAATAEYTGDEEQDNHLLAFGSIFSW